MYYCISLTKMDKIITLKNQNQYNLRNWSDICVPSIWGVNNVTESLRYLVLSKERKTVIKDSDTIKQILKSCSEVDTRVLSKIVSAKFNYKLLGTCTFLKHFIISAHFFVEIIKLHQFNSIFKSSQFARTLSMLGGVSWDNTFAINCCLLL